MLIKLKIIITIQHFIKSDKILYMDFSIDSNDLINFDDISTEQCTITTYEKDYDNTTMEKYKKMRTMKICPILDEPIDDNLAFKVENMWDPIIGEFLDKKDPFGALYFSPIELTKYFYLNRLNYLWTEEVDEGENGGYYEGIPGDGIGAGENFHIHGRGEHPEFFLWRLPINDCYLEKGLSKSIPIKGAKLSRNDIVNIYNKCLKYPKEVWKKTFSIIPNLVNIYDYYMEAINQNPDITGVDYTTGEDPKFKANLRAVFKLRSM
jgi:hypothetical protein